MDRPPIASMSQGGLDLSFPLSAEQTGGVMSVIQIQVAPGWLAPPHRHEREDELCLVLDGQVGWRIGDRELVANPGSVTFPTPGRAARVLESERLAGAAGAGVRPGRP